MSDADRSGDAESGAQASMPLRSRAEASLGMAKPRPDGRPAFTEVEVTAGIASLLWIVVVTLILVFARTEQSVTSQNAGFDGLRFVMTIIAVFLPVALIWVAATTVRWARVMQDEGKRLQAAVDAIRQGYLGGAQAAGGAKPSVERRIEELSRAQRRTEEALAAIASMASLPPAADTGRQAQPSYAPAAAAEPSSFAPEPAPEPEALPAAILISALNFPESPEDAAGFRALHKALQHATTGLLVQASQDVLTLLSQDGIYMDDLSLDRTQPSLWRRFAKGERGGEIAQLSAILEDSVVAQAASRMRSDTIFRDAVHHFLRKFDTMLSGFLPDASDAEIAAMIDTRSARAFMLLGRVAGAFE